MTRVDLLAKADKLRAERTPFVFATVVRTEKPASARAGDCAIVTADGELDGFVGGTCAESTVRLTGMNLLETGESTLLRITPDADEKPTRGADGLILVNNPCLSGGSLEIFLEPNIPATLIHVFGDAPAARALKSVGEALGYEVTLTADPETPIVPGTAAVIVSSHGRHEALMVTKGVRAGVPYVALVASPKRGRILVGGLVVSEEERARIKFPAGLDIGARTPAEIAMSVFAEMLAGRPRSAAGFKSSPATAPATADGVAGACLDVDDINTPAAEAPAAMQASGGSCCSAKAADPAVTEAATGAVTGAVTEAAAPVVEADAAEAPVEADGRPELGLTAAAPAAASGTEPAAKKSCCSS